MFKKTMGNIFSSDPPNGTAIVLWTVFDGKLRILVGRRHADAKYGPWEIGCPGGKREAGETSLEAAVRELREETGLEIHHSHFHEMGKLYSEKYGLCSMNYRVYVEPGAIISANLEWIGPLEWVPLENLLGGFYKNIPIFDPTRLSMETFVRQM